MAEEIAVNQPENHCCRCLNTKKHSDTWKCAEVCFEDLFWSCEYVTLLDLLGMPRLSNRRETLKLCQLFNIITCRLVHPSCPIVFKHTPYASHHRNTVQLVVPRAQAHCNQFKDLFMPSVTESWNALRFDKIGMNSIHYFKHTYSIIIIILLFCLLST